MVSDATLTDSVVVNLTINGVNDSPVITQGPGPLSLTVVEDGTVSQNSTPPMLIQAPVLPGGVPPMEPPGSIQAPDYLPYSPDANYYGNGHRDRRDLDSRHRIIYLNEDSNLTFGCKFGSNWNRHRRLQLVW